MATLRLPAKKAPPAPPEPDPAPGGPVAAAPPERTPKEKAERTHAQAERERREQIEARRRQRRYLRKGMAALRERWPELYATPVPLAVGVGPQIREVLPGMPYAQFRLVLRHWTQGTAYLLAVAAGGGERHNLDGSPAGVPAEDQQAFAQEELRRRGKWPVTGVQATAEPPTSVGWRKGGQTQHGPVPISRGLEALRDLLLLPLVILALLLMLPILLPLASFQAERNRRYLRATAAVTPCGCG